MALERTVRNTKRMISDLRNDGLYDNEIAEMIRVTEQTLRNWMNGTTPQQTPFERLCGLHEARGLAATT